MFRWLVQALILLLSVHARTLLAASVIGSCPDPEPLALASVDLKAYLGRWYEIGASASFKFNSETRLACIEPRYSLLNETDSGITIRVQNTGVPVLAEDSEPIFSSFSSNSTVLCKLLSPFVSARSDTRADRRVIHKAAHKLKSKKLGTLGAKLSHKLSEVAKAAATVSKRVTQLQLAVGAAMQAPGPSRPAKVDAAIQAVDHPISALKDLITFIQPLIVSIKQKLYGLGPDAEGAKGSAENLTAEVAKWKSQLAKLGATFGYIRAAASAAAALESKQFPRRFSPPGVGIRDPADPREGALQVSFSVGFPGKYTIIALEGEAKDGYKASLVYFCIDKAFAEFFTGGERVNLALLSRTPTLDEPIVKRLLSTAAKKGIRLKCNNPFIRTPQGPSCPN